MESGFTIGSFLIRLPPIRIATAGMGVIALTRYPTAAILVGWDRAAQTFVANASEA